MADTEKASSNHVVGAAPSTPKEGQNEYIIIVNKKVRSLSKKMTKISDIEKKQKTGAAINDEQKELLKKKDNTAKSLKEFESLKTQFLKVYNQEEKAQSKAKKKDDKKEKGELADQLRPLIDLLQVSSLLSGPDTRAKIEQEQRISGEELQSVVQLAALISQRQTSDDALNHAVKFLNQSEDVATVGRTYKKIRDNLDALRSTSLFPKSQPAAQEQVTPASESVKETVGVFTEFPSSPEPTHEDVTEQTEKSELVEVDGSEEGATTQELEEGSAETTETGQDAKEGGFQNRPYRGRGRGGRGGRGVRGGRGGRGGYYNRDNRGGDSYRGDNRRGGGADNYRGGAPRGGYRGGANVRGGGNFPQGQPQPQ